MDFQDLYDELEANGSEQTRKTYRRHGAKDPMFGVSFAVLGKLKKKAGKKGINHEAAVQLWKTGNTDCMTFAAMIADPQQISADQAEAWVSQINYVGVGDYFSELISKTPFAQQKLDQWIDSDQEFVKRAGYVILAFISKAGEPATAYLKKYIDKITKEIHTAPNRAREAMNNTIIAMGGVSPESRELVLKASEKIGPVEIDHGDTSCKTFIIKEYVEKIWDRKNKKTNV